MTHEGVRRATYQAVDCAKKNGAIISFDPNLRSPLWDTMDNIRLLNVIAGAEGSYSYYEGLRVFVPARKLKNTIETTGAGDTFCACVLNYILDHGLSGLREEELREMLSFANAAAALVTTRKGALRVMPSREEINGLL